MGFAEDKFMDYLRRNLTRIENIRIDELLLPLSACLTSTTVERLNTYVRNQGNRSTVLDFYLDLSRSDDWVNHFINALQYCGYVELAEKFQREYSSHRPRSLVSSPRSLPPSSSDRSKQPSQENPQCTSSLPGPMLPSSHDTQPGPSPKPGQPELERSQSSASGHNHEFRSLPPLPYDPPAPTRPTLSHSVSEPMQSDRRTLEDKMSKNPVPETAQYQAKPYKDDNGAFQKVPENGTYSPTSGDRGAGNRRRHPAQDERDAFPSQAANHQNQPVSLPLSEVCQDAQSAYPAAVNHSEQPASSPPAHSIKEEDSTVQQDAQPAQQDAQPAQHAAGNRPEQPASPPPARSVRRKVASEEPNYSQFARHPVPSGSSCRPLQNNDEEYFSKPGVLNSTPGVGDGSNEVGVLSETSVHVLQISDCSERSESSNTGQRSSPTSSIQGKVPHGSTPNHRSMQITDQRSPEENDFMFERSNTSSPKSSSAGNRRLDQSSSKQPEENSFGSRGESHYRLDFSEDPFAELLEGNDNGLKNRSRKIPNSKETDDQSMEQTRSTRRDRERTVLITITVISVCLSVFLLLKNRRN
ncbi:mitochondrial antiviral-signaling protein [Ranitomeya imitator]|uniref:mitochondrial antiviral-signaling protein n=1 Tax=Ranitomeya imitator TaxID=111125 RepID=UPI0037E9580B